MPDKNNSALAGEFLVAGELSRRGYSVSITMGKAKAIDIFAPEPRQSVSELLRAQVTLSSLFEF
jgi:hypothetical protein